MSAYVLGVRLVGEEMCIRDSFSPILWVIPSPFISVSSLGANSNAASLYLKNKGQTEQDLIKLNFMNLSILRPSILLGNRKENRVGEKIGIFAMKTLSPLFLGNMKKYKPIKVEYVSKAMLQVALKDYQKYIFESDEIVRIGSDV